MKDQDDVVLTDFDMPGMDGITLAFHIKETSPNTRVILMTGHDKESIMGRIENVEVDRALFKPFDLSRMVQILQEKQTQLEVKTAEHKPLVEAKM